MLSNISNISKAFKLKPKIKIPCRKRLCVHTIFVKYQFMVYVQMMRNVSICKCISIYIIKTINKLQANLAVINFSWQLMELPFFVLSKIKGCQSNFHTQLTQLGRPNHIKYTHASIYINFPDILKRKRHKTKFISYFFFSKEKLLPKCTLENSFQQKTSKNVSTLFCIFVCANSNACYTHCFN